MATREIKFRVWANGKMLPWKEAWHTVTRIDPALVGGQEGVEISLLIAAILARGNGGLSVEQWTGLMDKRGVEIFEGDLVRYYVPFRNSQTHYGENIPDPSGSFTEPLEPGIRTETRQVVFRNGAFHWADVSDDSGFDFPITLDNRVYSSRADLMEAFDCRRGERWWLDGMDDETGDLSWLLAEYGIADEEALMKHLSGFTVVGNVHQGVEKAFA